MEGAINSDDDDSPYASVDDNASTTNVSSPGSRTSPLAADEENRPAAIFSSSEGRAAFARAVASLEDENKSDVAAASGSEDRASPAVAAASLEDENTNISGVGDRASPAPAVEDEKTDASSAAVPSREDGAYPALAVKSLEDENTPPAAVSPTEDRASPAPLKSLEDDHNTAAAAAAEDKASPVEDQKRSSDVVSTAEDTAPSTHSNESDPTAKGKASPAVALMSSEDENKSATAVSVSTAEQSSNSQSEAPKSADVSPSAEKDAPPQNLGAPIDSILMVPEDGDPPGGGGANHYSYATYGESKSSSALEVKTSRNDVSNGHTLGDDKAEGKIVARPTTDDDCVPSVSSPYHRRCVSVDIIAKVPANYSSSTPSPKTTDSAKGTDNPGGLTRTQIDTAAPFESVKAAVSKFGGIVDWKAHRVHTVERRKFIEQELDKAQEEMPSYKQQCQAANEAKIQVLKKLESTKRLIEELKLNLERAQTEEQQAKQDSELAKLRVEEMEQGIADEASFAAKAQLEVAKARHAAAVSELKSVKDELEQLRRDYDLLIAEKEAAERKAEEALFASKQVEKSVESLTIELITLKQSLDSAHSAHLEAEEHRIGAVMAKEQDSLNWEVELKQAEEELEKLNRQMITTKELKSKLAEAKRLLQDLKAELAAYMESKSEETGNGDPLKEPVTKTRADIETAINAAKKELSDVKLKIEKATKEVNILKVASASLKSQLENESVELQAIQEREGTASAAAASLEAELNRVKSEIGIMQTKEQEEREKLVELPMQLQKAAQEAEQAKELARTAGEELKRARDEAEEAKAEVSTREGKLRAVQKEIEAAKAAERLALAAISALQESESAQRNVEEDSANGITLSLEEYYELSKRAHEAEEQANARVAAAMSQIEAAKESELKSLSKLEEVSRDMSRRKDALEVALQKAEQATERKLGVEQELRKWRADHEYKRKNAESLGPPPINTGRSSKDGKESKNHDHHQKSPKGTTTKGGDSTADGKAKKKKKSFFPRIFMFLGRKKSSHSSKGE
ncbi:protein WEAK CHLOROPLAST MOVEMENT UNDER BLUE LIGHT 1-like [Salvia miltiorrhiza]|uniref:protein WEAK CHLOROPLAST MOVEMENT UNDER BLUE LIGHT 1-like n=1 Tax=Salvia miltiorrhiza TaxID=226208 RepID=UPI0025ACADAF|nr:protein WEAK CHLOROPLAST MOVEMENT UNDER BLUE LIGHT 1-like [Salvia miltiorrhiza]XP_057786267.1 protein WEAK CHLOROPLAST MOVEMENT UNDER BLUE LIGHT 1-like [Salvia miltiorrhiza]